MRKVTKVIVIFLLFIGYILILGLYQAATNSRTGGILGIILLIGLIAAVRAVWKYNPEEIKNNTTIDNQDLDKF